MTFLKIAGYVIKVVEVDWNGALAVTIASFKDCPTFLRF